MCRCTPQRLLLHFQQQLPGLLFRQGRWLRLLLLGRWLRLLLLDRWLRLHLPDLLHPLFPLDRWLLLLPSDR